VEAFFLVHTFAVEVEAKKVALHESREAQLAHLQHELPPVSPPPVPSPLLAAQIEGEMQEAQSTSGGDCFMANLANLPHDTRKFLTFAGTKLMSLFGFCL
jgi:hypothetical protein